jgi:hypothetical protein
VLLWQPCLNPPFHDLCDLPKKLIRPLTETDFEERERINRFTENITLIF